MLSSLRLPKDLRDEILKEHTTQTYESQVIKSGNGYIPQKKVGRKEKRRNIKILNNDSHDFINSHIKCKCNKHIQKTVFLKKSVT